MQSSLYVSLSAQLSLQRRLDSIASNVANATTAGFRAEEVKFETLLSHTPAEPVAFASTGDTYLSRRSGEFVKTDNSLDIAVQGNAWLAISTPAGQVYTRDGRMRMTETGDLQTLNGHPILDVGGSPIQLDPAAGPLQIARDGMITQSGRQIGAIGLFAIDDNAKLTRHDNSGVVPDRPATPALDFSKVGISQGFVERSNVNPVMEMTRLIGVSRAFDAVTAAITESESSLRDAVKTLGSSS
jgi:flagellar basal-body rod protein FlgF